MAAWVPFGASAEDGAQKVREPMKRPNRERGIAMPAATRDPLAMNCTARRAAANRAGVVRCAAAIAATLCCSQLARAEHWISVGAFRAVESARQMAAQASAQTRLPFAALRAETNTGEVYRVVAGPYPTRQEAAIDLAQVRARGFAAAWVVGSSRRASAMKAAAAVAPARQPAQQKVAASALEPRRAAVATEPAALPDRWGDALPPIEVLLEGLPDASPPAAMPQREQGEPDAQGQHDRQGVLPQGYELHKLHRQVPAVEQTSSRRKGFDTALLGRSRSTTPGAKRSARPRRLATTPTGVRCDSAASARRGRSWTTPQHGCAATCKMRVA